MKKKMVVILTVFLFAVMATGVTASAGEIYSEGYFYYTKGEGCIIITGYFGQEAEAFVPDHIAGLPVSEIARGAFVRTTLSEIHLPFTVMTIQDGAFGEGITIYYDDGRTDEKETGNNGDKTNDSGKSENENIAKDKEKTDDNKVNNGDGGNPAGEEKHEAVLFQPPDEIKLRGEGDEVKAEAFNKLMDERADEAAEAFVNAELEKGIGTGILIFTICICTIAGAGITYKMVKNKKSKEK